MRLTLTLLFGIIVVLLILALLALFLWIGIRGSVPF